MFAFFKRPCHHLKRHQAQRLYRVHHSDAPLPAHEVSCHGCGQKVALPPLKQGKTARCPRCRHPLARVEANPFMLPPALAFTALILLWIVFSQPYLSTSLPGVSVDLTLPEMLRVLVLREFGYLAEVMFALTFGVPLLFCVLCLYVYGSLLADQAWRGVLSATRLLVRLRGWMMVDVFFISTLVAYIKLSSVADTTFGLAFWLMFVLAVVLIRCAQAIPEHWVYYQIYRLQNGSKISTPKGASISCSHCLFYQSVRQASCAVCGATLHHRKPHSLMISSALLLAAFILYFPANLLPIMISSNPTVTEVNTIFNGIVYMWRDGDKLIAMIIFSASIVVPVLKIIFMALLLWVARFGLPVSARALMRLYLFTESIGRWSMIDIFVIIILMSTFRTHIARVTAGPAALYFCLVVFLTMLAAHAFDPRLIWDKIQAHRNMLHAHSQTASHAQELNYDEA